MNARMLSSRILFIIGSVAMVVGILDPLEGSIIILPGSALALIGVAIGKSERRVLLYWVWVFVLIAAGVGAMFVLSSMGGFGGVDRPGRSMLWGLTILPYPIGWIMGVRGIILRVVEAFKTRRQTATS